MTPKVFQLPAIGTPLRRVDWRLDARGLEWTGDDGHDRWMPYACIRLATLGKSRASGWRLRLSGPPGAVIIAAGQDAPQGDIRTFSDLATKLISGAAEAGCKAKFRLNHANRASPTWLWARRGTPVQMASELIRSLPEPVEDR